MGCIKTKPKTVENDIESRISDAMAKFNDDALAKFKENEFKAMGDELKTVLENGKKVENTLNNLIAAINVLNPQVRMQSLNLNQDSESESSVRKIRDSISLERERRANNNDLSQQSEHPIISGPAINNYTCESRLNINP